MAEIREGRELRHVSPPTQARSTDTMVNALNRVIDERRAKIKFSSSFESADNDWSD
jgi:hypothetical protein